MTLEMMSRNWFVDLAADHKDDLEEEEMVCFLFFSLPSPLQFVECAANLWDVHHKIKRTLFACMLHPKIVGERLLDH